LVKVGLSFLIPRRFVKLSEPVFGSFNFGAELKGIRNNEGFGDEIREAYGF